MSDGPSTSCSWAAPSSSLVCLPCMNLPRYLPSHLIGHDNKKQRYACTDNTHLHLTTLTLATSPYSPRASNSPPIQASVSCGCSYYSCSMALFFQQLGLGQDPGLAYFWPDAADAPIVLPLLSSMLLRYCYLLISPYLYILSNTQHYSASNSPRMCEGHQSLTATL
jgi:hypothetical protein